MEKTMKQYVVMTEVGDRFLVMDINKERVLIESGYQIKTNLFRSFSLTELWGGERAVRKLVEQCLVKWKNNVTLFTELVFLLNWKGWIHSGMGNEKYEKLYFKLYRQVFRKGMSLFRGEDLMYFINILD